MTDAAVGQAWLALSPLMGAVDLSTARWSFGLGAGDYDAFHPEADVPTA